MKRVILALSTLMLASLACNAIQGGTAAPNAVQPDKKVLFYDTFSDANSGWPTSSDTEKSAGYMPDGTYQIQAVTTQQDVWAHPGKTFGDVSVEVDAVKSGGPDNNGFGIVCRYVDNDNFYYLMVSSDGYQVIGKYEGGENKYLSSDKMQPTAAVNSGTIGNHLRGDCVGSTLTLFANGQQLSSVTDTSFTSGDVGLIVGTFDEPNVSLSFDNFVANQP